ncbi:hypothetical protein B0H19DRAFT_1271311 [Mycena capillaripes]|nr:hypothetical protein B0H19DRAFT_1271311 [Mycena capillaripes]
MSFISPTRMIAVHKAPAHLSREELEKKYLLLAKAFASLPIVQKHAIKYEVCFANPTFDEQIRVINLHASDTTVIAIFETDSDTSLMEVMTDPAFRKVMEGADFLDRSAGGTFVVDTISLIDKSQNKDGQVV